MSSTVSMYVAFVDLANTKFGAGELGKQDGETTISLESLSLKKSDF